MRPKPTGNALGGVAYINLDRIAKESEWLDCIAEESGCMARPHCKRERVRGLWHRIVEKSRRLARPHCKESGHVAQLRGKRVCTCDPAALQYFEVSDLLPWESRVRFVGISEPTIRQSAHTISLECFGQPIGVWQSAKILFSLLPLVYINTCPFLLFSFASVTRE